MALWDFLTKKKKPTDGNDLEAVVNPAAKPKVNFLDQFLPEDETKKQALAQALLLGGAGMMAAGGPSATPTNLLGVLGQGVGSGVVGYNKSLENSADAMNARTASSAQNAKAQQAQAGVQFASSIGAPRGEAGYSVEQLQQIFEYQLQTGDEAGARDTLGMIQKLQQHAAGEGMIVGDNGFQLAPGYDQSLFDTKKAESLGTAVGDNAKTTSDQKNFEYGNANPAFRQYETDQRKASAATTNINNAGPKDGKIFEAMDKERENAAQSVAGLKLVYEMKNSLPNAITGFGADYLLAGQKAIAALGGDSSRVVDTETLKTQAMELAAKMKGDLVGNQQISNSDMEFVQRVAAGDARLDSGTMGRLMDLREKQLSGNIDRYNSRIGSIYPDIPENKINRDFFGGIAVPENPYAGQEKTGSVGESGQQPDTEAVRVVVVGSEAAYEKLPAGAKYRFESDPIGTLRTKT